MACQYTDRRTVPCKGEEDQVKGKEIAEIEYRGKPVKLYMDRYPSGKVAIIAYGVYGDPYGTLSASLDHLPPPPEGSFWVKGWGEHREFAACAWGSNVFTKVGTTRLPYCSGFITVEAWSIKP
jgi:hypothetical protein